MKLTAMAVVVLALLGSVVIHAAAQVGTASAASTETTDRQDLAAALAAGVRALEENDNAAAEQWFRKALRLDPDSIGVLNNLATSVARQGRAAEAIAIYQRALRLKSNDPMTRRNLGIAYFRARRYGEALPYLTEFARETPTFQSLDLAGLDLFALNRYREAASYLDRASRMQPDDLPTLSILGKAYWRAHDYSGVTGVFKRIMAVDPHSPEAHYMLGLAYDIEFKEQEAQKEFEAVIAADPNYPGIHSSLGLVAWRQRDFKQAESQFRQQLALTPTDPVSNYMMGLTLQQENQPELAVKSLTAAIRVNPSYKDALLALGKSYLTLKKPRESLKPLLRAATLDPGSAQAHFMLARAYRQLGRTADAHREDAICSRLEAQQHRR